MCVRVWFGLTHTSPTRGASRCVEMLKTRETRRSSQCTDHHSEEEPISLSFESTHAHSTLSEHSCVCWTHAYLAHTRTLHFVRRERRVLDSRIPGSHTHTPLCKKRATCAGLMHTSITHAHVACVRACVVWTHAYIAHTRTLHAVRIFWTHAHLVCTHTRIHAHTRTHTRTHMLDAS